jgi:dTDP-glucose 4,6-dehydratase/UDP-glucuronate decarboxylase
LSIDKIIEEDVRDIYLEIGGVLKAIEGSSFLISGGAGFLGSYIMDLIKFCSDNIFIEPVTVICIDNLVTGIPDRVEHLKDNEDFIFLNADISKPLEIDQDVDYIINAASIASPTFYRRYPIETLETNVLGLKHLIELGMKKGIKSFLNISSSEIYGDPDSAHIPTGEDYNGNVSCTGPRACYDESKRLGETMCVNYCKEYGVPVKTVRPFNVFGPGLKLDDGRVIPDFFSDAFHRHKIKILSDGTPTRSFCYASDAVKGFMLALLSEFNGEAFNIGNNKTEISIKDVGSLIAEIVGNVTIEYKKSKEADYLTDNPQRRCPDLAKANSYLNYYPKVGLETGLLRMYQWYKQTYNL